MSSDTIRILIVDDHAVVRKGLAMVLRLEPDLDVIGEAQNGREGLEAVERLHPDLVLLDLVMPDMDGHDMALALRARHPHIKILMLTGTQVDDQVVDLLAAGIEGYVFKNIEPAELVAAIRAARPIFIPMSCVAPLNACASMPSLLPFPSRHANWKCWNGWLLP